MKQILTMILGCLVIALCIPLEAKKLRWAHTPKCYCECHENDESCKTPRRMSSEKRRKKKRLERKKIAEVHEVHEQLLHDLSLNVTNEPAPLPVSESTSLLPDDYPMNEHLEAFRKSTREQKERILQTHEEFSKLEKAQEEFERCRRRLRDLDPELEEKICGINPSDTSTQALSIDNQKATPASGLDAELEKLEQEFAQAEEMSLPEIKQLSAEPTVSEVSFTLPKPSSLSMEEDTSAKKLATQEEFERCRKQLRALDPDLEEKICGPNPSNTQPMDPAEFAYE